MAYDRTDERRGHRGERPRWSDDDLRDRERAHGQGREERGFFERAGDQISSWFGDDDEHRGPGRHDQRGDWLRDERGRGFGERGSERGDEGWFSPGRQGSDRDQRSSRDERSDHVRPTDWSNSNRDYGGRNYRERADRDYRPMAGDYGRSDDEGGRSKWDRDEYRRTSFAGSAARSAHDDPHYNEHRQRHLDELDRDYDEYRRERQSTFERDFGSWRERRQSKRQLLSQIREHMEVVGSDGEHVGTVDRVAGDRIILTRSDPESGGAHHSLSCTDLDRIEGDKLMLEWKADEARNRWRDESRERALFEREDQGSSGPHMLDRSVSGTYR